MSAALRGLVLAVLALGCATGGKDGGGDGTPADAAASKDASLVSDAPPVSFDAPMVVVDARPDAAPSVPPDAPPGSLFCTANNQCMVSGECCLTLGGPMGFCAPGTVVFGTCVPPIN